MLNRRRQSERGQALVESALFMPLFLIAMFALIFFGRLGVTSERAQTAVRYANLVTFRNGQAYTAATLYDLLNELLNPTASELGPLCLQPNSLTGSPNNTISAAAYAALTQSQPNITATPLPNAKSFWVPDSILTPACNPLSVALTSGTYNVANLPVSVTSFQVQGQINTPSYLQPLLGTSRTAGASMAFLNVATPNMLVACVPGVSLVLILLANMQNVGTPNCNPNSNPIVF
jgi:hypothetical protein